MTSRRSLASRQSSDAPFPRVPRARQPTALPPYEPPSCPLTVNEQRTLARKSLSVDYRKYDNHLKAAVANITNCTGDINERLYARKERVRRMAERREATDPDAEKSTAEEEAEVQVREMEVKVEQLTARSEQALRDLVDYKFDLAERKGMLEKVIQEAAASHPPPDKNANPEEAAQDEDEEMEGAASQATILSPIELLKKAREEHDAAYKSLSMRVRYAENNDYKGFKRLLHDVQNPGENQPPMPHASTWFPAENVDQPTAAAARRRRLATNTDNIESCDDDDEIQMTGVISSLKCPLTLQTFKEPYSNYVCKHTFEKSAILEYFHQNAVAFIDPSQGGRRGRGVPQGPKQIKCPERGCDTMLQLKEFYGDQMILRQVKRQAAQAAAEAEEEEEEELESGDDVVIPSTQRAARQGLAGSFGGDSRGVRSQTLKQESEVRDISDEDGATESGEGEMEE